MIRTKLMKHQERIVHYCLDKRYAAIFADYGLGKTLAFLALCQVKKWRRILVISTKTSVNTTWPSEIRTHSDFRYVKLLGPRRKKLQRLAVGTEAADRLFPGGRPATVVFLLNYDGVKNISYELARAGFDVVVADESTKIKSARAKRTVHLWGLSHFIPHRFIMTGFPVTEGLHNLYAQVKFLDKGASLGDNYWKFLRTHFVKHGPRTVPKRKSVTAIKKAISPYTIRVPSTEIYLPNPIYKEVRVEQTPEQDRVLAQMNNYFKLEFGQIQIDMKYIFTLIQKSLQICDGFVYGGDGKIGVIPTEKDEALLDVLEDIDATRNKVVIWCYFDFTAQKLFRLLTAKQVGYTCVWLKGGHDPEKVIWQFQHNPKVQIIILTMKEAAESITLTAARYAVYYGNWWSYGDRGNSEARIRRKGSEHHPYVCYIDLLVNKTPEVQVYECLRGKKNLVQELKRVFMDLGGPTAEPTEGEED